MIIGLTGRMRSGKNSVADSLNDFFSLSFASPLKDAVGILYSISHNQMEYKKDELDPRYAKTPRELLQTVGTFLRSQTPDIFVKNCQKRIKHVQRNNQNVVITDIRYDNEADMIRSMGGIIIEIKRDNIPFSSDHESEKGLSTVDFVIYNNSTVQDLGREINRLVEKLKEPRSICI